MDRPLRKLVAEESTLINARLMDVYEHLLRHYGARHWWPADTAFEMIIGAILTQSVAWSNVEKAIANLKAANALDPVALDSLPIDELAQLIRPSRFFNVKAGTIKAFLAHLQGYEYDLDAFFSKSVDALRGELLSIRGVGLETADSIILYGAHKPIFVIDAYTKQLMQRLGLVDHGISYIELQAFFESDLPRETGLFQEYHAQIVHHCHATCQMKPLCKACPLLSLCGFGQGQGQLREER